MKWFGPEGVPFPEMERIATPRDATCRWCEEAIEDHHIGVTIPTLLEDRTFEESPFHRECFVRQLVGSVPHQKRECSFPGASCDDPPGMTRREAAMFAYGFFLVRSG